MEAKSVISCLQNVQQVCRISKATLSTIDGRAVTEGGVSDNPGKKPDGVVAHVRHSLPYDGHA